MQIWKEQCPPPGEKKKLPGVPLYVWGGFVWFESAGIETTVQTIGIGWDVPNPGRYVGTWQDTPFVWHLYEGVD